MTFSAQSSGARPSLADFMGSRKVVYKINRELTPDRVAAYLEESFEWFFGKKSRFSEEIARRLDSK